MSKPATKSFTPVSLAVDAILVLGFFALIYSLVASHVPSSDIWMIRFWGGLTAGCLTAVFWLCIQMFRAVLRFQRETRR